MATNSEVYNYEKKIEQLLARVRSSSICEPNKRAEGFYQYLVVNSISLGRVLKYLQEIFNLAQLRNKAFVDFAKSDVMELVQHIELNKAWAEWTKHDYKLSIKRLFKFLRDTEDYPREVCWIRIWSRSWRKPFPELLTEEGVRRMAQACMNPQDKALVLFLYESGCRIGEVLSMQIKDVAFDKYGAHVTVDGKTGPRKIRVVASVPVLAFWMGYHPDKRNPNAPLWVSFGRKKEFSRLASAYVAKQCRQGQYCHGPHLAETFRVCSWEVQGHSG